MKTKNILFFVFILIVHNISASSSSNKQIIDGVMQSLIVMSDQEVRDKLESYHNISIIHAPPIFSKKHPADQANEIYNALQDNDIEFNLTLPQQSELFSIFNSNIDVHNQEKIKNDIISKSFGTTAMITAFYTPAFIEKFIHAEQSKIFVVDDLITGMAIKTAWKTALPIVATSIGAFIVWRQFDYWLHTEERVRAIKMENEYRAGFSEVKKEFDKRDIAMHAYINQYCHNLEEKLELLSTQTQLINQANNNIQSARTEMANIQQTISSLKENNILMKAQLAKMNPVLQQVYQTTQIIMQTHKEQNQNKAATSLINTQTQNNDDDNNLHNHKKSSQWYNIFGSKK